MIALILAVLIGGSSSDVIRVDAIELNHYHDCCGRYILSQFIFKRWGHWKDGKKYHVADWRIAKDPYRLKQSDNQHSLRMFIDNHEYNFTTPVFRETWTTFDPERVDLESLPQDERRSFFGDCQ